MKKCSLKILQPFSKWNWFIDIVLISLDSEHQSLNSFACSADIFLSQSCPLAAQLLLSRNRILMVKGEHIPIGSSIAEIKDRTTLFSYFLLKFLAQFHDILWDYPCLHSSSVQVLRMSAARPRKFSQLSLICPSLWFVTWLHRHSLSISSKWMHLCWGGFGPFGRIRLLLVVIWLTWGTRPSRSFAGQFWQEFRRLSRYLSLLDANRNLHDSARSCSLLKRVVCTRRLLFSPSGSSLQRNRKYLLPPLGTATWINIASMSVESAIWCSRNRKIIPIRHCNRSGQDKSLSLRATPW